jgi:multidrug transporter EmrE-like cation transporter
MDFTKLLIGILLGFIGQIGSFMQLQGAIKYNWYEKYLWLILISSIPISWLYIKSVTYLVEGCGGEIWPSRLMGFAVGIMVFSILSIILFKEPLTLKTIICLLLSFCIVLVQLVMK